MPPELPRPVPPVGTRRLSRAGLVIGAVGDGSPDELERLVDEVFARSAVVMPSANTIRVGIGGWVYPPWRGVFYPPGLRQARELAHASRQVTAIEINGTFYGAQKPASFRRWYEETPGDFIFSVKGPRFATHRSDLATAGPSI
ncbi:MAG: DUF72 domain-containing protein, partial [Stellaceae bacterium]